MEGGGGKKETFSVFKEVKHTPERAETYPREGSLSFLGLPLQLRDSENLLIKQETRVRSLGREDALEKRMATHSSTLAQRIPLTEEPGGLQSMGSQRDTTE